MNDRINIEDWFSPETDCLTPEQAAAYQRGELSAKEKHAVEKHLFSCDLCAEAYEGLDEPLDEAEIEAGAAAITDMAWQRVAERERKKRRGAVYWMSAAAGIALLITVGFFVFKSQQDEKLDSVFAENFEQYPVEQDQPPSPKGITERGTGVDNDLAQNMEDLGSKDKLSDDFGDAETIKSLESADGDLADMPAPEMEEEIFVMEEIEELDIVEAEPDNFGGKLKYYDSDVEVENSRKLMSKDIENQSGKDQLASKPSANRYRNEGEKREDKSPTGGMDFAVVTKEEKVQNATSVPAKPQELMKVNDLKNVTSTTTGASEVNTITTTESLSKRDLDNKSGGRGWFNKKSKQSASAPSQDRSKGNADGMALNQERAANDIVSLDEMEDALDDGFADGESPSEAPGAQNSRTQAFDAYQQGKYTLAVSHFQNHLAGSPGDHEARLLLANSFLSLNEPFQALTELDKILGSSSATASRKLDAKWYKSLALIKLKRKTEAKSVLQELVNHGGKYAERAQKTLDQL